MGYPSECARTLLLKEIKPRSYDALKESSLCSSAIHNRVKASILISMSGHFDSVPDVKSYLDHFERHPTTSVFFSEREVEVCEGKTYFLILSISLYTMIVSST